MWLNNNSEDRYRACRSVLGEAAWTRLSIQCAKELAEHSLSSVLLEIGKNTLPAFLSELARLEEIANTVEIGKASLPKAVSQPLVNPTIQIMELSWKNLVPHLHPDQNIPAVHPIQAHERVLLWYDPFKDRVSARPVSDEDLLVLKMVVEGISSKVVAAQGGLLVGTVDAALFRAIAIGLVFTPPSRIRRDPKLFPRNNCIPEQYLSSPSFTLQWHITQTCDLHCKHCYYRRSRSQTTLDQSLLLLDGPFHPSSRTDVYSRPDIYKEDHFIGQKVYT